VFIAFLVFVAKEAMKKDIEKNSMGEVVVFSRCFF
jgi:hypothetical protein